MLSRLTKQASNLLSRGERMLNRTMKKTSFKYMVFTAFLIASADGDFDSEERAALIKLIQRDYPDFDTKDVISYIKECEEKVAFDSKLGTQEIIDILAQADEEDARMIMRTCAYIGAADGVYDPSEKLMARTLAYSLKLKPSDYGL